MWKKLMEMFKGKNQTSQINQQTMNLTLRQRIYLSRLRKEKQLTQK